MTRRPDRRRFAFGLLLATALGAGLGQAVLVQAFRQLEARRVERVSLATVAAAVDVVQRCGAEGEAVRTAVASLAAQHPHIRALRVISLTGALLEASTAPEDQGAKAAPRRLAPDEKALFDLGQGLRAAIQTNREEGASRKEEIDVRPAAAGGLALAAPIEREGAMTGVVQMETKKAPPQRRPEAAAFLIAIFLPPLLFVLLSLVIGERRVLLAVLAAALLLAALIGFDRHGSEQLAAAYRAGEGGVAAQLAAEASTARSALQTASVAESPALEPATWDVDQFRKPRGVLTAAGTPDPQMLARGSREAADSLLGAHVLLGLLSIGLLVLVATGWAARLKDTIVHYRYAYIYVAPALIGMLLLVFFPFIYGIALSFTDANIYNSNKPIADIWLGMRNFTAILGDFHIMQHTPAGYVINYQNFYWTLLFTIAWTVANVTIGVTVGLLLALILNTKGFALRPAYRVLLILPWAMPNYITALIWKGMFHQQFGTVNQIIQALGGHPVAWFEKVGTSFAAVVATNGWLSFPFMMVISLGALQSIPADLYEAARVDGATRWQQFRSITLPSLKPALVPAVILSVIWTFNMFNIIYLVSGGEPAHGTELLITQAYKFAFEQYRYGYAAAYSTVIFVILFLYGMWQNRVTRATEAI